MRRYAAARAVGLGIVFSLLFALFATPARAADERSVILVTLDGFRWQEVFGGAQAELLDPKAGGVPDVAALKKKFWRETAAERREALMPFFWGVVAKQGQVFGDPSQGSPAQITNGLKFSYPGYNEFLTGHADPRVDSNDKVPNPNVNVLEWLNGRPGFSGRVAAFGTWDVLYSILNVQRSKVPTLAAYDPIVDDALTPRERMLNEILPTLPRLWPDNNFDFFSAEAMLEHVKKHKPRVAYLQLGETDEWAHSRRYDCYLEAAYNSDRFLQRLWEAVQATPEYAGKTTLILTTDHGRGQTIADWVDHGEKVDGAEFVWMAVIGPSTPADGVRMNVKATQSQIAATVAEAVGENYRAGVPEAAEPLAGAVKETGK